MTKTVQFLPFFFVIQRNLTLLFSMTYLINVDQLCQHHPRVVDASLHSPQRQTPRSGYLVQGITLRELNKRVNAYRSSAHTLDEVQQVMDDGALVSCRASLALPLSQSLGVHVLQSLLRVHPQVAHDGPTPWQQRTVHVVGVACLQCPLHRVGGKVVGTFLVMGVVTALRNGDEGEVHLHNLLLKVHGS